MEKREIIASQILIWLICLLALYVGIGGLGNEDYKNKLISLNTNGPAIGDTVPVKEGLIEYPNVFEMKKIEIIEQQNNFMQFYPWLEKLPDIISLLFTCGSFSLLGSFLFITRNIISNRSKVSIIKYPAIVLSSLLTGLVIMGLSYLLPIVLINDGGKIRPIALMFLSLVGGMYSNTLYKKLSKYVENLLESD
jgi:hypothetical protein